MSWKHRIGALVLLVATLFHTTPARAGNDDKLAALGQRAHALAARFQAALDPDQCRSVTSCKVTMAVGILDDGSVIVATSEPTNKPRAPLVKILDEVGAEFVDVGGSKHAEEKVVNFPATTLFRRSRKVLVVAAGRPICPDCERIIVAAGARPASPCRSGNRY